MGTVVISQPVRAPDTSVWEAPLSGSTVWFLVPKVPRVSRVPSLLLICDEKKLSYALLGPPSGR